MGTPGLGQLSDGRVRSARSRIGRDEQPIAVSDHIAAGDGAERPLAARSAFRIFTGALLPKGADTIVVQEDTIRHGDVIEVTCEPRLGQHIRRAGSDIAQDQVIVRRGQRLRPGDVSLLASQGYENAPVFSRPAVTVLTTGDELKPPGSGRPGRGEIIDGNTVALMNAVRGRALAQWLALHSPMRPLQRNVGFENVLLAAL